MSNRKSKYNLIVVLGPTASGKTTFATHLALNINSQIISADSRQVYRGMDIGTGKDLSDYKVGEKQVPYHLIDIVDAGYKYNVFEYQRDFKQVYLNISNDTAIPLLCGGTGMYIEAVTKAYKLINVPVNESLRSELEDNPQEELVRILQQHTQLHNTTDLTNRKRLIRAIEIAKYQNENPDLDSDFPEIRPIYLGVKVDRNTRRKRITDRLYNRLNDGMIKEVEILLNKGVKPEDLIFYGLEYKFITLYLTGQLSYDEMVSKLNVSIHQFAKRQMTWFRKMEKQGDTIHWIDGFLPVEQMVDQATKLIFKD